MTDRRCPECHVLIRPAEGQDDEVMCPLCRGWILAIAGSEEVLYVSHWHQV